MKINVMLMLFVSLMLITACAPSQKTGQDQTKDSDLVVYGLAGYIKEIETNSNGTMGILVEGELGKNGADYHRGYVTVTEETIVYGEAGQTDQELEVGQYVTIFFDGDVMESDPIQARARQINIVPESALEFQEDPTEK